MAQDVDQEIEEELVELEQVDGEHLMEQHQVVIQQPQVH